MCMLCVIQKWSRRVATMLPWLVIPLIGLWALSQLLPPAFRFEITSPRLACVLVLLTTLFWYEILMPQLSAWRVSRNARLRERERLRAIEFHKLRKTAKRCCRNCLTQYRDQNPAGGRFMCSYCGHISKRPALDLPVPPGMRLSNSGITKDLMTKGGKMSSRKACSENSWMCGQDWLEDRHWINGPLMGKSTFWRKNPGVFFTGDDHCLADKPYSVVIFSCKLLTLFFLSMRWVWKKMFRVSTSGDDASPNADCKRDENGTNFHESRGEKARRKAEEKRQARLEKELLEEEDRKQREEVSRLVEERRRLRDERVGTAKDRSKGTAPVKERESKKDAEKKRKEKRKEKDKGSSKSNSDVEELEKRAGKENGRKHEFDRKGEVDRREHQKTATESAQIHSMEMGHGLQRDTVNNFNKGNTGSRYLDRMRGTFLSPSKAFSKGNLFAKGSSSAANTAATTVLRDNKSNYFVDHIQHSASRREHSAEKLNMNGSDQSTHHSQVLPEQQTMTAPKKSWQQLFTRSTDVPPSSNVNVISRPNVKYQADGQCSQLAAQSSLTQSFDNPITFGLPSPFTLPSFPAGSTSSAGFPYATHSIFPHVGEVHCDVLPEEPDIFEDPCYNPDPVSLLGPVSESLDNFQLDLGAGFVTDVGIQRSHGLNNLYASSEVNRPSPIESPMSKLRISDQKHSTPKAQDVRARSTDDLCIAKDNGTWQMWNSSPLVQDGLGLVGGTTGWNLPLELNRSSKEDIVHSSSHRTTTSLLTKEDQVHSGAHSPDKAFIGNGQNIAMFHHLSGSDNHLSLNPQEEIAQNEMTHLSPRTTVVNYPFEPAPANPWPKKERGVQGSEEGAGSKSVARSPVGGGRSEVCKVQRKELEAKVLQGPLLEEVFLPLRM